MKIYKVEFNNVKNNDYIIKNGLYKATDIVDFIRVKNNCLAAKEIDLEYLRQFGDGFLKVELVGELFENPKNNKNITINVSCNLVGKEDVEKMIEELQKKLNSLKVNVSI